MIDEIERIIDQEPDPGSDYYHSTLLGNPDGTTERFVFGEFAGYTEGKPQYELRRASLVKADVVRTTCQKLNEYCCVVNDEGDLFAWLIAGGHAVVQTDLIEKYFCEVLEPYPVIRKPTGGYLTLQSVEQKKLARRPDPKLRMQVFNRDQRRCVICGSSATTSQHVELEAHHVMNWHRGGITVLENLATVCSICHKGLTPHEDWSLFPLIGTSVVRDLLSTSEDYYERVGFYRTTTTKLLRTSDPRRRVRADQITRD